MTEHSISHGEAVARDERERLDRVARAIHDANYGNNAVTLWENPAIRRDAYALAKVAVDAYHGHGIAEERSDDKSDLGGTE